MARHLWIENILMKENPNLKQKTIEQRNSGKDYDKKVKPTTN